jgi:hypothetical protein
MILSRNKVRHNELQVLGYQRRDPLTRIAFSRMGIDFTISSLVFLICLLHVYFMSASGRCTRRKVREIGPTFVSGDDSFGSSRTRVTRLNRRPVWQGSSSGLTATTPSD